MELNGKRFLVNCASFDDATELQDAVGEALKGTKLDFSGLTAMAGGNLAQVMEKDLAEFSGPIETAVGLALSVITSKRVRAALFKCCEKALLGDDKIDRDFFEKPENRELYYPIMVEIIKVNIGPFFKRLGSLFGGPGNLFQTFLKSKST